MSSQYVSYLLGIAHGLLEQCRNYLISKEDVDGVALIEPGYQDLIKGIQKTYTMEDGRLGKGQ